MRVVAAVEAVEEEGGVAVGEAVGAEDGVRGLQSDVEDLEGLGEVALKTLGGREGFLEPDVGGLEVSC